MTKYYPQQEAQETGGGVNGLSLFSGTAIGELAFKQIIPNYRTVGYVEWDKYCQEVIRARIKDGVLDDAPIFGDIREFNAEYAERYAGKVDWLSGGFPCQPFSVAGNRLGEADERNMWPATRDAISIIRPRFCLLENVPAILAHEYIRTIFGDLAEIGYDCEWDVIGASHVGAPHRRLRWWCLAYPEGKRTHRKPKELCQEDGRQGGALSGQSVCSSDVANTNESGLSKSICRKFGSIQCTEGSFARRQFSGGDATPRGWWSTEPNVGRVAHGVADVMDRLKALGNGWVPQVVKRILSITEVE